MTKRLKILVPLVMIVGCEQVATTPPIHETPTPTPTPQPPPPAPKPGAVPTHNFPIGSLIIPTTSAWQNQCGAVSAYGLIYDILRANNYLFTTFGKRITLYYVFRSTKASPNRCKPTSLDTPPSPSGDPKWNDGCDFTLTGAPPVKLVNNASATGADISPFSSINTVGSSVSFPTYSNRSVSGGMTVQYMGGPFMIDQTDAALFRQLLQGTVIAQDDNGNNIDFGPFRSAGGCFGLGSRHYVNIHATQVAATIEINRQFTQTPPRLALLADDTKGETSGISKGILENYLVNAGLNFSGASGCPPSGTNSGNKKLCPNKGKPGQIFDFFDFNDLKNNLMTAVDSKGRPFYSAVWAPHWDTSAGGFSAPNSNETTAINNISNWLEAQNGLMAECASINALEGAYQNGNKFSVKTTQFLTCVNNSGACAVGTTNWGIDQNPNGTPSGFFKNCTDPNQANGNQCVFYGYPPDPFSQVGDWLWNESGGTTKSYKPNAATSSIYRPGVNVLISGVRTLDTSKTGNPTAARAIITADYVAYGNKTSNAAKGEIHYVGTHDQSGNVSGNLVILQTLLQLGTPPTTVVPVTQEVGRSSPVAATIGATKVLVQGTFEDVFPAVTPPLQIGLVAGDDVTFEFPDIKGHLRGYDPADISTTADLFTNTSATFDATNLIPTANYGGCAHFTSSCRTVFTNTATGRLPNGGTPVFIDNSTRPSVGPLTGLGTAALQDTLLARVLAGVKVGSVYVSKLGGIDRSTATIVQPSPVAGSASRPSMIYVGAADGMLHAICASADAPCDQIGRELWAFIPRTQLPMLRFNTGRIDGSPRAADVFGDFTNTGVKRFATILTFHTGIMQSVLAPAVTPAVPTPAVYALDVSDPANPRIVWEYDSPSFPGKYEMGLALTIAMGPTKLNPPQVAATGTFPVTIIESSNGGTGGAGVVVTALSTETGSDICTPAPCAGTGNPIWKSGFVYPSPMRGGAIGPLVPATGIPGGAVGVDKLSIAELTDLVAGDLYGNLWELDPATGISRHEPAAPPAGELVTPLFSSTLNFTPIGAPPAIFSDTTEQYAVFATGGYTDPTAAPQWGSGPQFITAVRLNALSPPAPLNETQAGSLIAPSPKVDVVFNTAIAAGERAFSQVLVVGGQFFVTTDSQDINAAGYGNNGSSNTGKMYFANTDGTGASSAVINSGGSSVVNIDTTIYGSSADSAQQVASATSTVGPKVDYSSVSIAKVTRTLWLRTQ